MRKFLMASAALALIGATMAHADDGDKEVLGGAAGGAAGAAAGDGGNGRGLRNRGTVRPLCSSAPVVMSSRDGRMGGWAVGVGLLALLAYFLELGVATAADTESAKFERVG